MLILLVSSAFEEHESEEVSTSQNKYLRSGSVIILDRVLDNISGFPLELPSFLIDLRVTGFK